MDHRVDAPDQLAYGRLFPSAPSSHSMTSACVLEPATVAARPIPAAEAMSCVCEMPYEVVAKEACGTRDGNVHAELRKGNRKRALCPCVICRALTLFCTFRD